MSDDRTMPDGVPADVTEVSAEVLDELGRLFGDQTIDDDPSVTVTIAEDGGTGASETVQIIDAGDPSAPPLVVPVDRTVDDSPAGGEVLAFSRPVPAPAPADPLLVIDEDTVIHDSSTDVDPRFEERRKAWARRDRFKRVRWWKLAGLLAIVVIVVLALLASPLFAIRRLSVEGTVYTSDKSVADVRRILKGTSIFTADTARARAALLADPWVADVRITTHFPSSAVVEVSERVPVVWYVGSDNKARMVDARGHVIAVLDGFPTKYLQVKGTGPEVKAGDIADDAYRAAAQLVLALPDELRPLVVALDLSPAGELSMVLKGDTMVKFGTPSDLQNKLVAVVVLLRRQDPKTIAVIDVSAGDPTVLGR